MFRKRTQLRSCLRVCRESQGWTENQDLPDPLGHRETKDSLGSTEHQEPRERKDWMVLTESKDFLGPATTQRGFLF